MESFLNNTSCFLDDERWLRVMHSAICKDESLAGQQSLIFNLWGYLVSGPRLFMETIDIIFSPKTPPQCVIDELLERLMRARNGLLWWLSQARELAGGSRNGELESCGDDLTLFWPMFENSSLASGDITQLTLRGTYTMCHILKARLLYSLAPSRFRHLEVECQKWARKIIDLRPSASKDRGGKLIWSVFMSQRNWIAKEILETKDAWSEGWEGREGVIERWKFGAWCRAIGRKFPER